MFNTTCPGNDQNDETHFHAAVSCIAGSLKTQIISRSYDEVAICFFNTGLDLFSICLLKDLSICGDCTYFLCVYSDQLTLVKLGQVSIK
ncbi:hypothetical protein E1A91_D07G193200v1 [Gossypium mustelinum]|uniref:Ku70/Ku80 N-terminal alpha/beta domain-containing protein n=1 Tax=Gossypium mustelinum TaxID=34275 RepID=A0A5D2UBB1_GOSMU|nr:hypothetical protein E1A91_D07G193200v1 [Gossypium mustelinum]